MLFVARPAAAAIPANYVTVVDQQGANDVNSSQVDLTQLGRDDVDPNTYKLLWSWDATDDWTGSGQTGDACALFDSNGDGNVDFAVCAQIQNPAANPNIVTEAVASPYAYSCNDSKNDRCGNPTSVPIPGAAVISGAINELTGAILPSPPANLITATDPFPNLNPDQNFPNDSTIAINIAKSFLPNPGADLINVCTYPSAGNGGNNNPFDCIMRPGDGLLVIKKVATVQTSQVFSFTVNPGNRSFDITGSGQTDETGMEPGSTTSVSETVPANWALDSASCVLEDGTSTGTKNGSAVSGITIQSGLLTTCTFTNSPKPPELTVVKDNDANHDGTYTDTELVPAGDVYPYAVTYKATISNAAGSSTSTITTIGDDKVVNPLRSAEGSDLDCEDLIGTTLAAGQTKTCYFDAVFQNANQAEVVNTLSVTAINNVGTSTKTDTSTVKFPGKIEFEKTADAASVSAGDPIGFTLTVTNVGAGVANGVTVSDTLPANAGLSWSESPDDQQCSISGGVLTCHFGTLAAGASESVHVTSPTAAASCGTINNTGNASSTDGGSDSASATVDVRCAAIDVLKTADAASVAAGEQIGFTVTLSNAGQGEAKGVQFTDVLPTGLAWSISPASAGWSISNGNLVYAPSTLAAGASTSVHVVATTSKENCGEVKNTASVTTSNDGQDESSASVDVNCAAIDVLKTADAASVSAGDPIGFTVKITNTGAGEAKGLQFTDVLPAGLDWAISPASAGWSIANGNLVYAPSTLAAGASTSVHVVAATTKDDCGKVNNTASVSTSNDGQDESSASVDVNCGDVTITKVADANSVSSGHQIGFVINVTNDGAGEARGVTVQDTLPTGSGLSWSIDDESSDAGCVIDAGELTCEFGTIGSENSKQVHIVSPTTAESCGQVDNTATVTTSNDGSDEASDSTFVDCPAIAVEKSGPATAYHGDQVTFTYEVTNPGNAALAGITVSDDKCPNVVGPNSKQNGNENDALDPGELWIYSCTMTIPAHQDGEPNPLVNTVTVTGTDRHEETHTATDSHETRILHPAVDIEKTGPATALVGTPLGYTLTVTNPGDVPFAAQEVGVTDPKCEQPPAGPNTGTDATPNQLDPGDTWTYTCTAQTTGQPAGTFVNTATVTAKDFNGRTVSDTDEFPTVLSAPAQPVPPGEQQVLPEEIVSGTARLGGPSGCVRKAFNATVRGRQIASVTFYVDGKRVKRIIAKQGQAVFRAKVLPGSAVGVHRVTARVVFKAASQTKARTLRLSYQRCARQVVTPKFTG
jgi:uncharacterized repeat protein (TIGR01451 family)